MSSLTELLKSKNGNEFNKPYCRRCDFWTNEVVCGDNKFYECPSCGRSEPVFNYGNPENVLPDCSGNITDIAEKIGIPFDRRENGNAHIVCPVCVSDNYDLHLATTVMHKEYCRELFSAKGYDLVLALRPPDNKHFYCVNCGVSGDLFAYVSMWCAIDDPFHKMSDMSEMTEAATEWLIENYSVSSLCKIILKDVNWHLYPDAECENIDYLISLISKNRVFFKNMLSQTVEDSFTSLYYDFMDHLF